MYFVWHFKQLSILAGKNILVNSVVSYLKSKLLKNEFQILSIKQSQPLFSKLFW